VCNAVTKTLLIAVLFSCKHAPPPDCSALATVPHAIYTPSNVFGESSCAMRCEAGWLDCDQSEANGCETSAVGRAPHTTIELGAFTACTVGCERGWFDCDGNLQNGCEAQSCSD